MAVADLGRRCVHLYIPEEERYVRLTGSERDPVVSPVAVAFRARAVLAQFVSARTNVSRRCGLKCSHAGGRPYTVIGRSGRVVVSTAFGVTPGPRGGVESRALV